MTKKIQPDIEEMEKWLVRKQNEIEDKKKK